ncbi:MAG: ABC transporter ATP-binding protein [Chloroflexi bacterium]|nr:ABC transporter ATP-binding protein [Chloroflexota bacterium]
MSGVVVRCRGLGKAFGPVVAVDRLDLDLEHGRVLVLLGPSGCGKTTVLRLIAGFEAPDSGAVEVGGQLVVGPGAFVPPEKRRVGMVFQDYALFPHLTVRENVAFGLPRGRSDRVRDVLALVGLTGMEGRLPHELSGGQQQRVALARALAPDPKVLLLDEPFSNLDARFRAQVREDIKRILKASEVTVIFVTHDQEEALFMGDMIAVMNQGRLEQVDTPERAFHAPQTPFVARIMGMADFLPAHPSDGALLTEVGPLPPLSAVGPGDTVEVMVRPDDLLFRPAEEGQGQIVGRVFQGAFYLYQVALDSGLVVHCLQPHTVDYPVGLRVQVRLNPAHLPLCFVNGSSLPPGAGLSPWER